MTCATLITRSDYRSDITHCDIQTNWMIFRSPNYQFMCPQTYNFFIENVTLRVCEELRGTPGSLTLPELIPFS